MGSGVSVSFDPIAVAHPERLSARLDPRLGAALIERLRACPRLRPRLARVLVAPPPLDGEETGEGAGALAERLTECDPEELARLAGAVWHANALKLVISGKAVAELVQRIGPHARAFGLRNAALAVAEEAVATEPAELAQAIERDGLRCLGAWLARVPAETRARLLLRLPPASPAELVDGDAAGLVRAPAIMARVLAERDEAPEAAQAAREPSGAA